MFLGTLCLWVIYSFIFLVIAKRLYLLLLFCWCFLFSLSFLPAVFFCVHCFWLFFFCKMAHFVWLFSYYFSLFYRYFLCKCSKDVFFVMCIVYTENKRYDDLFWAENHFSCIPKPLLFIVSSSYFHDVITEYAFKLYVH